MKPMSRAAIPVKNSYLRIIICLVALFALIFPISLSPLSAEPAIGQITAEVKEGVQPGGSTWEYDLGISCATNVCEEASIFIPFTKGVRENWKFELTSASDFGGNIKASVAEHENQKGYRFTLSEPLATGSSANFLLRITPTAGRVENGHTWTIDPIFSFRTQGEIKNVTTPDSGLATFSYLYAYLFAKLFADFSERPDSAGHDINLEVNPGSTIWLQLVYSETDELFHDPNTPIKFELTVPAGFEYDPTVGNTEGVSYDPTSRVMIIERMWQNPSGTSFFREKGNVAFKVTGEASGKSLVQVKASATPFGETEPYVVAHADTNITTKSFEILSSYLIPTLRGNLMDFLLPPPEYGTSGVESIVTKPANLTVNINRNPNNPYRTRLAVNLPCFDNPLEGGGFGARYHENIAAIFPTPGSSCAAGSPMVVKSLGAIGPYDLVPEIEYTLHYKDGSSSTVKVSVTSRDQKKKPIEIDSDREIVSISAEFDVPARSAGTVKTFTIDTEIGLVIKDDPRISHGDKLEGIAAFSGQKSDGKWSYPYNQSFQANIWNGQRHVDIGAWDVTTLLDSKGSIAAGHYSYFEPIASVSMGDRQAQDQLARTVILFPPLETGIEMYKMTGSFHQNVIKEIGGNFTFHENYRGTGRQAYEITGPMTATVGKLGTFFNAKNAVPGIYEYDVYVGFDGSSDPGECVTHKIYPSSSGFVPGNGYEADKVTPEFWPVDDTVTCHVTGKIILRGSSNGEFLLDKKIRDDETSNFQSASEVPLSSLDGTVEYELSFANTGPNALKEVEIYDVLARKGVSNSTASVHLVENVTAPEGYEVSYSTASNPCRERLDNSNTDCVDDWSLEPPLDLSSVTAIRLLAKPGTLLESGKKISVRLQAAMEDDAAPGSVAWSAATGQAASTVSDGFLPNSGTAAVGFMSLGLVNAAEPTMTGVCGPENDLVHLPNVEGVDYEVSAWHNGKITVTAVTKPYYVFPAGAVTYWEFTDVNEMCPVGPGNPGNPVDPGDPGNPEPKPGPKPEPTPAVAAPGKEEIKQSKPQAKLVRTGASGVGAAVSVALLLLMLGVHLRRARAEHS